MQQASVSQSSMPGETEYPSPLIPLADKRVSRTPWGDGPLLVSTRRAGKHSALVRAVSGRVTCMTTMTGRSADGTSMVPALHLPTMLLDSELCSMTVPAEPRQLMIGQVM